MVAPLTGPHPGLSVGGVTAAKYSYVCTLVQSRPLSETSTSTASALTLSKLVPSPPSHGGE